MKSALISRLQRFLTLTAQEHEWLARFEQETRHVPARTVLYREGDAIEYAHVLRYGWAVVRGRCCNGRTPLLRIYLPGEIIGLAEIGQARSLHSIQMQTDGGISTFPRSLFADLMHNAPRLAALLLSLNSMDQMFLRERVGALTHMDGSARMIHFLLQMRDRLAPVMNNKSSRFELPFSQTEIADVLGLTTVYVNRILRKLREEGRLEIEGRTVRLLDVKGMERDVNHRNLQQALDTRWFYSDTPPAADADPSTPIA